MSLLVEDKLLITTGKEDTEQLGKAVSNDSDRFNQLKQRLL